MKQHTEKKCQKFGIIAYNSTYTRNVGKVDTHTKSLMCQQLQLSIIHTQLLYWFEIIPKKISFVFLFTGSTWGIRWCTLNYIVSIMLSMHNVGVKRIPFSQLNDGKQ